MRLPMKPLRRTIAALSLLWAICSPLAAVAQAPPAVGALPDSERRTSYSLSGTTCACAINMQLYASGSDVDAWLQVWVNGVRYLSTDPTFGWSLSSTTGPLTTIPRPITNAVLTFNSPVTGTVQIVGAERPRQLAQFSENTGVPARALNQRMTEITAIERELWDKTNDLSGRGLFFAPGNTTGPMPKPAACASSFLGFDGTGLNPICIVFGTPGAGNVVGQSPSVANDVALFNNLTGSLIKSGAALTGQIGGLNVGTAVSPAANILLTVNKNSASPPTPVAGTVAQFVAADSSSTTAEIDAFASFPILQLSRADGTGAVPSAIQSGDIFGIISGRGYGATGYSAGAAQIRLLAAQTFTDAAQGSRISLLTTPNGVTASGNVREVARFDQDRSSTLFGPTVLTANGITTYSCDLVCALLTVNNNAAAAPSWVNAVGEQWAIQVAGKDGQATVIGIDSFGTGNTAAFSIFDFRRTNGTAASPSALKSGDLIGVLGAIGYGATGYSSGAAQYRVFTTQDWTDTAQGSLVEILTTANGVPASGNARAVIRLDQDRTTLLFGKAVIGGQLLASGGASIPLVDINGSAAATNFVGGSNAPMLRLLAADGNATNQAFQNYGSQNQFSAFQAANTAASPTALTGAGTVIFNFNGFAYDGTGWFNTGSSSNVAIQLQTSQTQTTSAHGTQIAFLTTPNGTLAKATALIVQASGALALGGATTDTGNGTVSMTLATTSKGATITATAPGAGNTELLFGCGTNAGTAALFAGAGTSTTATRVLDNIGASVTGC
jgi:hypothetical protein